MDPTVIEPSFFAFLDSYKTVLGGLSIALATVVAVYLNYIVSKKTARRQRNERVASIAAALASELMDNTDNLIELYNEIEGKNTKRHKVLQHQSFQSLAYEKLLSQIGEVGAPLSFMLVDVYGDLIKLTRTLGVLSIQEIVSEEEDFLILIKEILAKALTTSIVVILYSDFLNGRRYSFEIQSKREVWIEQTLDTFCTYVSESEDEVDLVYTQQTGDGDFAKSFPKKEDRQQIKEVLSAIQKAIKKANKEPAWKAPLIFRALSYKIQMVLTYFLGLENSIYEQVLQEEYSKYLES